MRNPYIQTLLPLRPVEQCETRPIEDFERPMADNIPTNWGPAIGLALCVAVVGLVWWAASTWVLQ